MKIRKRLFIAKEEALRGPENLRIFRAHRSPGTIAWG